MPQETIDISRTISEGALVYPGDDPIQLERRWRIGPDCPFNMSKLSWTTHAVTHLDPPFHFFEEGMSIDEIPLARFIGEARVVEITGDSIGTDDIPPFESIQGRNLLFKTRHSTESDPRRFDPHHVFMTAEAAYAVVARGVNLVGIDYLSLDRHGDEAFPVHRILLGGNVLILEGLDLSGAGAGRYTLAAFPLKLAHGDGAPVRAVLIP